VEENMPRTFDIEPLDATVGAVVGGIRVTDLDDATWRELYAAWLQYAQLIFPDQHLARDQQIAFARRFGLLEFEMAAISTVKSDGTLRRKGDNDDMMKVLKGNMGWQGCAGA
jgi:alpha-ketoglutarate-dependent taurine dioxygenase